MRVRAIVIFLIALAGCGAAVAAQMNDQWHVIEFDWDLEEEGFTRTGEYTIIYGLDEVRASSENCIDDDCESDDEQEKMSKIIENCNSQDDEERKEDCEAIVAATTNTLYAMNGVYGWGFFAVLASLFAIIGISGNKFAGFFTLILSVLLFATAIYHIMTFPELGDSFTGDDDDNQINVSEYPGQATWILGGGGILTLIGAVLGLRGGSKDDGYSDMPESGSSYYHGSWQD